MVLKAMANDRRHFALCHDQFRGPRSGLCRSGISAPPKSVAAFANALLGRPMTGDISLTLRSKRIPILSTDGERG
ncbi:hypothetical protein TNCV_731601 [Trichonephila clavipes]|nr:hypothetical protein TNCV_731601 [Trichonephila clavipes]